MEVSDMEKPQDKQTEGVLKEIETAIREGQRAKSIEKLEKSLEDLGALISSLEKEKDYYHMSWALYILADCNLWLGYSIKNSKKEEAAYYMKAREYFEDSLYVTVPDINNPRHTDTVSRLFWLQRSLLGEIEDKKVEAEPKRLVNKIFTDKTETQINHRIYLRVSRRLGLASDDNPNVVAKLLLLQGYYMQQLVVKNGNPDNISVDMEACCIWMKILEMYDKGIEIWPGIIHRAVRGILKHLPDIDLDKVLKYSKIGLENGKGREEVYIDEIMMACVYASRRIKRTCPYMNLDINM